MLPFDPSMSLHDLTIFSIPSTLHRPERACAGTSFTPSKCPSLSTGGGERSKMEGRAALDRAGPQGPVPTANGGGKPGCCCTRLSLSSFIQRGNIVAFHYVDGEAPSLVNASVTPTTTYPTTAY